MAAELIIGFRLSRQLESAEALAPALVKARGLLERIGALVDGWEYDRFENLLLVRLRAGREVAKEAEKLIAGALGGELGLGSEPAPPAPSGFAVATEALPSPSVLGLLLRASAAQLEVPGLSRAEALALLAYYACGLDEVKALFAAAVLGEEPARLREALARLREKGVVGSDGSLTREGEELLERLADALRARRPTESRGQPAMVVDEEGNLEPFSPDKLAYSLYSCGVPYGLVSTIARQVEEVVGGRRYVGKRVLAMVTRSLLDEAYPAEGIAERFYSYVYALESVYVSVGGEVRRVTWGLLRRVSSEVLGERGLRPPRRLVRRHAEVIASELRSLVAHAYRYFEGRALKLEELRDLGRRTAPLVSFAWLDLSSTPREELAERYREAARGYLSAAAGSRDLGYRKEFVGRALLLLSAGLMLKYSLLPSNSTPLNLSALRAELGRARLPGDARAALARFCKLGAKLARKPLLIGPREARRVERQIAELRSLAERL